MPNFKRVYRALHQAQKLRSNAAMRKAFRVAKEEGWATHVKVYQKVTL